VASAAKKPRKPVTLGGLLRAARERDADALSFEKMARHFEKVYGVDVTGQTLSNYHHDEVQKPNVEIVLVLVEYYGLKFRDLPADIRIRCEQTLERFVSATGTRKYAPRDSNPEPADSVDKGSNVAVGQAA
jgi:hypothetical protein